MQWPPSPIVEDEAASLAKENGTNGPAAEGNVDVLVPSRGTPDQTPVIVDSDGGIDTRTPANEPSSKCAYETTPAKNPVQPSTSTSFQAEIKLPSHPAPEGEVRGRTYSNDMGKASQGTSAAPRSRSAAGINDNRPSRPPLSRIETDIAGGVQRMNGGARRAPSPYRYDPEKGRSYKVKTFGTNSNSPESNSSPSNAKESPVTNATSRNRQETSSTHSENKDGPHVRDRDRHEPLHSTNAHTGSTSTLDRPSETQHHSEQRQVRASERIQAPGREGRVSRTSSKVLESPHSSSAEESTTADRLTRSTHHGSDEPHVRRRSSHRREGPRLEELSNHRTVPQKLGPSRDEGSRYVYRIRDGHSPLTPPIFSSSQHYEDSIRDAFHKNALKAPFRHPSLASVNESAVFSPPTSPPRTPRGERPGSQDYFESPLSTPTRTPTRSRRPSVDESHLKDSKIHNSLLSQATSAAAAAAVVNKNTSPVQSRSVSNAIETTFACTNKPQTVRPRSRASSPQRERINRSDTFTYGDKTMPRINYPPVPKVTRPSTRDGLPTMEPAPARNEKQYPIQGHMDDYPMPTNARTSTIPSGRWPVAPQIHRSHSATTPQELGWKSGEFSLPLCPRSQPIQGLRDWITFRNIPGIDICPSCVMAVASTRHKSQLIRSEDKTYDKPTVCTFSKPWMRVAFKECVNLNHGNLDILKMANTPTNNPCQGAEPTIRRWYQLFDPDGNRAVSDFFACSACVDTVERIFPDLPHQFGRGRKDIPQEKVCGLRPDSKHFMALMNELHEISARCRDRDQYKARYMLPFIDHVRLITDERECAKDRMLYNRAWHFSKYLPEFTVCPACYKEVVWPQRDKPVARDIYVMADLAPSLAISKTARNSASGPTHATSCQLYSTRMRQLFHDVTMKRISYQKFENAVKDRQELQLRLAEINLAYEKDQKMGIDRRADIARNKQVWKDNE